MSDIFDIFERFGIGGDVDRPDRCWGVRSLVVYTVIVHIQYEFIIRKSNVLRSAGHTSK